YVPSTRAAVDDDRSWSADERLTWRMTAKSTVAFNYLHDTACNCHWLITPEAVPETALHSTFFTNVAGAKGEAMLTDRLAAQVSGSTVRTNLSATPQPEAVAPAAIDIALSNLNLRS